MENKINLKDNIVNTSELVVDYRKNGVIYNCETSVVEREMNGLADINVVFNEQDISLEEYMKIVDKHINLNKLEHPVFEEILEKAQEIKKFLNVFDSFYLEYSLFVAGGAVRDGILNKDVRDIDFFIEMPPAFIDINTIINSEYYLKVKNINPENIFIKYVQYLKNTGFNNFMLDKETLKDPLFKKNLEKKEGVIFDGSIDVVRSFKYSSYGFFMSFLSDLISIDKKHKDYINNTVDSFAVIRESKDGVDKNYQNIGKNYLGAVFKFYEEKDNFDLIFLQPNCKVMDDFDWNICKASILLYEKKFIMNKKLTKKSSSINDDVDYILDVLVEKSNEKIDAMYLEKFREENKKKGFEIKTLKTNKGYTEMEMDIPLKKEDLMSRFRVDVGFIEDIEFKKLTYKMEIVRKRELERSLFERAKKFKDKFSDYKVNIIKPIVLDVEYTPFDKDSDEYLKYVENLYEKMLMELAIGTKPVISKSKKTLKF